MAPSFFKSLFDPSLPHLSLPHGFVTENKIPTGPVCLFAGGGYAWRLKIKKCGDNFCFANGWSNVVKDIGLRYADYLLFRLVDPSTFEMMIFKPNASENILPDVHKHEDDDDDEDDGDEEDKNEDDDDPFFISKICKKMLRFPKEFAVLAGIVDEQTMKMKNLDGKEWDVGVRLEKAINYKRYYLLSGWRDVLRGNDLSEGDECVFKFIRSEGKLLITKITKKQYCGGDEETIK